MLRTPHCIDNQLIDDCYVALSAGRALPPENSSDTHFCWKLSKQQDLVRLEGLGKLKIDLIETRSSDLSACSIAPEPSTLPRALRKEM
jgi:hypothetical protein